MTNHLIIFCKAPHLGTVKSRLARDIGAIAAAAFYRRNLKDTFNRLRSDKRWTCRPAITPDRAARENGPWPRGIPCFPQGEGDLGRRMDRAMRRPPPGPVVLIGADTPGITPAHIAAAFKALGNHDAVFGPAADGGFWLVGMKRRPAMPYLYANVRWSTEHALADTIKNLPSGFTHALVDTLHDVDDGADYARWRNLRNLA